MVSEIAVGYCDYVRERLKEHMGDPTATNELSKFENEDISKRLKKLMEDTLDTYKLFGTIF